MAKPLHLDDISVGDSFESGEYEMTQEAIIAFAQEFDPQPFHTDPDAAQHTFFGGLAASGWHTAAVTMRLVTEAMPFADGVIGAGGEIHWPTPTRPGDVLRVISTVEEVVPSRSKPGRARVVVHCRTVDRHGEVKQEFRPNLVLWARGAEVKG